MKTSIGYDNFNTLLLRLLGTNSPTKRITYLNEWAIQCDYDKTQLEPILSFLNTQRDEKAKQGSLGGKSQRDIGQEVVSVLKDLKEVIAKKSIEPSPRQRKTNTGDHYKRPIWVAKCAGVNCDECGDEIDGCAFRWKQDGEYSSWHPTCIPSKNKALFEGVKGYREHFGLNVPVAREEDEVA